MGEISSVVVIVLTVALGAGIAVAAAGHDARTHRLPNRLTGALAVVALVGFVLAAVLAGGGVPWGALALGSAFCAGPWLVTHLVAPSQIGFGDVKLAAGLGLYLGRLDPDLALVAVMAAGVLLLAQWRIRPAGGDRRSRPALPFGPALVGGAVLAGLLGLAAELAGW